MIVARVIWLHDQSSLGHWRFLTLPRAGETLVLPVEERELFRVEGVEHSPQPEREDEISPSATLYVQYLGEAG